MKVAAYQAPYRDYPATGGSALLAAHLPRLVEARVELVCAPEALIGELANETDGDSPALVALDPAALREAISPLLGWPLTIVVGFTERAGDDLHNSAAVIIDGELAGIYRKVRPGRSVCVPGTELPIFHHRGIAFGVLICNDVHVAEPARGIASRGAQLLVVPVHGGHRPEKEAALRPTGNGVLLDRARENGLPLVAADIAGWQGERVSHGTTTIIDGTGTRLASARELEEDVIVAAVAVGSRG